MTTPNPIPPLPSPPFFSIPNINNLRDPALLPLRTTSNLSLRPTLLFRSADVSKLTPANWTALHDLGIAHVFDLRSAPEVAKGWAGIVGADAAKRPDNDGLEGDIRPGWVEAMEAAGVKRTWTPVFDAKDYSPERLAERYGKYMDESVRGFVYAYRDILANGGPAYRTILLYLAGLRVADDGTAQGALIHCTAGKDRTGIFFGILFDFLGVPREKIAEEYNLTEQGLMCIREEVVGRLLQTPGFVKYMRAQMAGQALSEDDVAATLRGEGQDSEETVEIPPEVREKGRQAALRMIGSRKESMLGALDMVDEVFGGAERYMREKCGLGDEELEALRRNLLVQSGK